MTEREANVRHQDRILVECDGEEREVFNWVTVEMTHQVRVGQTESFNPRICAGDLVGGPEPDAITTWVDEQLYQEFSIDNHDIPVIDIESDEVTVL